MSTNAIENWLPVVGYEGLYQVSDLGRIRSVDREVTSRNAFGPMTKALTGQIIAHDLSNPKGYHRVHLNRDGVGKHHFVHHLVLEAHVGPRPAGMQACHHDDNRDRNELSNLAWKAPEENIADRYRNGGYAPLTHCRKRQHPLTGSNVTVRKNGHRECLACRRIRESKKVEVAA